MASERFDSCRIVDLLRRCRLRFTYTVGRRFPRNARGVYAFWRGKTCLYVGETIHFPRRMDEHRDRTHNPKLYQWFQSFPDNIEVSFVRIEDADKRLLQRVEAQVIRCLNPDTNAGLR